MKSRLIRPIEGFTYTKGSESSFFIIPDNNTSNCSLYSAVKSF